jgi:hypothetical protein
MCYVRKAVDMANAIDEFVDEINRYKVTVDDINDIGFFKPEILVTLKTIRDWLTSSREEVKVIEEYDIIVEQQNSLPGFEELNELIEEEVVENEEPEEAPTEEGLVEEEPTKEESVKEEVVEETSKRKYNKLSEKNYRFIAGFIADNFDGVDVKTARAQLVERLPGLPFRSVYRFIEKQTWKKISDEYFTLDKKNVIHVVENRPKDEAQDYIEELISNIKYPDKFHKILNEFGITDEVQWKGPMHNLAKVNCEMEAIVANFPDITASALTTYEVVKKAMIVGGLMNSGLTDLDMVIIIASTIQKVGKRKISRIASSVRKQWSVGNLRSDQIYAVLNKSWYPDIVAKYGI